MAQQYAYAYAEIDLETGECVHVFSTSAPINTEANPQLIVIPEYYEDYIGNYYNQSDGKWYTDAAFTTEFIPE